MNNNNFCSNKYFYEPRKKDWLLYCLYLLQSIAIKYFCCCGALYLDRIESILKTSKLLDLTSEVCTEEFEKCMNKYVQMADPGSASC